ncbi:hypothetical protein RN69_26860 [Bradyrhizobium japonicum]|nr:hypothetical protein RN69_26860 [Bradyrhizobium japonicum]
MAHRRQPSGLLLWRRHQTPVRCSAMRTVWLAFGNFGMIAMGVFNRTAMLCSSFIVSTMSG